MADKIDVEVRTPSVSGDTGRNSPIIYRTDGVSDYEELDNKPQINDVELVGNKSFPDLGMRPMTNMEIMEILRRNINA